MKKRIKLFDPVFGLEERKSIIDTLNSGFWASGAGTNKVKKFENNFNKFVGSKSSIALNSGTAALHLAMSISKIQNKEVIVPSMSFVSSANCVLYNGGKPIFVDIDPNTLCIDCDSIEEKITKNTSAILAVHFAGLPANLGKLKKIAKKHNLTLIEDAAHACGAKYEGKKIGTHSPFVCFSFHPVKNLAMPSGGLISINNSKNDEIQKKLSALRWCGISDRDGVKYDVKELGWNFYMNEFSAAIGLEQLKKLNKLNSCRKKIAKRYHYELNILEKMPFDKDCVYHFYWILVNNQDKFRKKLLDAGIETGIHYLPIHKMSLYKSKISLPKTEYAGKSIISLPTHPNLTDSDVTRIIKTVNSIEKNWN